MTADTTRAIDRMLHPYQAGERIRARQPIYCATKQVTVEAGTVGRIVDPQATGCIGVLLVEWRRAKDQAGVTIGPVTFHVSAEGVEPEPS